MNKPYLGVPIVLIVLSIAIYAPQRLEFVRNRLVQGNWITNYLYTVLACYLMWYLSQLWNHNNTLGKAFIYLGRNSLVIFAFHRPVLNWIIEPIIRYMMPAVSYYVFWGASLISLIMLYLMLNFILRKYFPVLLGQPTNKSVL